MSVLSARDGYRLWAPRYSEETVVSWLEEQLVIRLRVQTCGRSLLDVGCGTGRRLKPTNAAFAVGVDLSVEMLARAAHVRPLGVADVRALPFAPGTFDVVWCRLVIGHVEELEAALGEIARVCRRGGVVVLTDFHPHAAESGHRRTFRDVTGRVHELEHHVHSLLAQRDVGGEVGLRLLAARRGVVGPLVRPMYVDAGRLDMYEAQRGLPLVLGTVFEKVR